MFPMIYKNTVAYVVATVSVLLCLIFFSIYSCISELITDDYYNKINQLSRQEVLSCTSHLDILADNMCFITNNLNIPQLLEQNETHAKISQHISSIVKYSPYITDVYIYRGDELVFSFISKKISPNFTPDHTPSEKKEGWRIITMAGKPSLCYCTTIAPDLTVAFLVDNKNIFDSFTGDENFFNRHEILATSLNGPTISYFGRDCTEYIAETSDSVKTVKDKIVFSSPIRGNITVYTIADNTYIGNMLRSILLFFIIILCISIIACYACVKRLANKITYGLNDIHSNMSQYCAEDTEGLNGNVENTNC